MATKPKTAAGYNADLTASCESVLLTLLSAFGSLKSTLRLVGGLVPRYLTPEKPPDTPAHAGTSDVDIVLDLQVIAEGDGYASLAEQLAARGFTRFINEDGNKSSWRWERKINDHQSVLVEFIRDAGTDTPGKPRSIEGEKVSALTVKHAGIVHNWHLELEIKGQLLDGGGHSTETIRFADVPAFVILKALALDDRQENKDAADLIHVLRYAGNMEQVVEMFFERMQSGQHGEAMEAGLSALRRRFCDEPGVEGHSQMGSVAYARFHNTGDNEQLALDQRFASGLVQELLGEIEKRRARQ